MKLALVVLLFSLTALAGSQDSYQYFNSNGVHIAYRVFGSGTPLIVLNGGLAALATRSPPLHRP